MTSRSLLANLIAGTAVLAFFSAPASAQPCGPTQTVKLLPADGAMGDQFGWSVSVSGDTAVIGARFGDDNGTDSGSAYIYRFDGTSWVLEAKLLPADGAVGDEFGNSVSVSGDTAVIGARFDDDNGTDSGSAYIFRFDGTSWVQEAKLLAADGTFDDFFGFSVSVSGDTAVIGANRDRSNGPNSGSAYVFEFDGTNWVQVVKLAPAGVAADHQFGRSVSISGDTAVVGAWRDNDNNIPAGAAYVFRFDGTSWMLEAKLLANDRAFGDEFGISVSIFGDTAVIGADGDDASLSNSGSAYVFRFDGTGWVQETKLLAADAAVNDFFGFSVSVAGDTAVVGAILDDDNGLGSGSAYAFRFDGTAWAQEAKIVPADGGQNENFGVSVSVSGDTALIGSRSDDNGLDSGSAYIFDLDPCLPDTNGDGVLTGGDFTAWINAFNNNLPECDQNCDGACTPTDFTAWIANFNAGCP